MPSTLTIIRQRRRSRNQVRSSASRRWRRAVQGLGFALGVLAVALTLFLALGYASLAGGLPPVEELTVLLHPQDGLLLQPTRLYDRSGQHLVAALSPGGSPRLYALYEHLPPALLDATLALAEPDFWDSPGYTRDGWRDPGSHPTLAQRLVSDLLLWDEPPSTRRAVQERMLAAQVTARYGRQQVLEWYLNSADYGHYAHGAEEAAQFYFGKSVTQIDLGEAALLAAVGLAPALNPLDAPRAAEERRLEALQAMLAQGLIDAGQAARAMDDVPVIVADGSGISADLAPAFTGLVLAQLGTQFDPGRLGRGGLVVVTSMDYDLQIQAACAAATHLERLAGSSAAVPAADGSPCQAARLLPALQPDESLPGASASALVLDPAEGQVLAAVGDISPRPAGTSITPFIYLTGFARGLNPASLGWDIPGGEPALGQVYHGPVRLRTALVNDYLPPANRLLDQMGVESVRGVAASFGLRLPSRPLGSDFEVSPLALAAAYGVFANQGVLAGQPLSGAGLEPVAVLRLTGLDHSVWLDWTAPRRQALVSPQLAYLMNHVLGDETARWPSLGHPSPLEIGRPAGAKASRTLDSSAAWTAGYTPRRVAVVWLGGPSTPAAGAGSVPPRLAAVLWHALAQYAGSGLPSTGWEAPQGVLTMAVCDPSGMLPTAACPNVVGEVFLDGRQPVQADTLYQAFHVNVETGLLATVFTPPELVEERVYLAVPPEARRWAEAAGLPQPPAQYDTVRRPASSAEAQITWPEMFADGRGVLSILGSAAGEDFDSYRLEYGQGLYPRAWVQIGADSTTPVTDGLLAEWDTAGLDGLYALRLMVVRADRRVDQAVLQVTLDNTPPQVAISYPLPGAEVGLAEEPQVLFQAQVNDPFLEKVEFYVDDSLVGEPALAPFGVAWQARLGNYVLRVVAVDRAGNRSEARINFSVKR